MDRNIIMSELSKLINDNLGQRITPALGTGILTTMNTLMLQMEVPKDDSGDAQQS